MSRLMVDVFLDSLFDLGPGYLECCVRTRVPGPRLLVLDLDTVGHHLPQLLPVAVPSMGYTLQLMDDRFYQNEAREQ